MSNTSNIIDPIPLLKQYYNSIRTTNELYMHYIRFPDTAQQVGTWRQDKYEKALTEYNKTQESQLRQQHKLLQASLRNQLDKLLPEWKSLPYEQFLTSI